MMVCTGPDDYGQTQILIDALGMHLYCCAANINKRQALA
jgi:hypothetical protein